VAPKVAIIILNWNGWRDTIECLESVQRLTYPNYQIIVVDNGSTDHSVERIKAWIRGEIHGLTGKEKASKPLQVIEISRAAVLNSTTSDFLKRLSAQRTITIIRNDENLGVAGGYNTGLIYALRQRYEWAWLLDQDSLPEPNALSELLHTWEATGKKAGVLFPSRVDKSTGVIYKPVRWRGKRWTKAFSETNQPTDPIPVDAAGFSGMLIHMHILQDAGWPREDYFVGYDDQEFCLRVRDHGFVILYAPTSKIRLSVGKPRAFRIAGREILSTNHPPYRYYYTSRNKIYTHWHAHPDPLAVLFALSTILKLFIVILLFEQGKLLKARFILKGALDGICSKMGKVMEPV